MRNEDGFSSFHRNKGKRDFYEGKYRNNLRISRFFGAILVPETHLYISRDALSQKKKAEKPGHPQGERRSTGISQGQRDTDIPTRQRLPKKDIKHLEFRHL